MQLHFREFGHGQPLILLHGLFGSLDNWFGIAPKLSEKFRVLALDLRNHGQSPHSAETNYGLMADDLAEFIHTHALAGSFVLGHSLGGKVAMQLALQHPSAMKRLVVVDMAPRAYAPVHETIFQALRKLDLKSFTARQPIEEALAAEIPELGVRRFLLKNLGRNPDGAFYWKLNLRGLHENYLELGRALSGTAFARPTLFIRGGKSDYIRAPEDFADIRRLFPSAQIQTIAAAGHLVHADAPDEFVRLVRDFLEAA